MEELCKNIRELLPGCKVVGVILTNKYAYVSIQSSDFSFRYYISRCDTVNISDIIGSIKGGILTIYNQKTIEHEILMKEGENIV